MNKLWAPWRMEYILSPKSDECIFCHPPEITVDSERLILFATRYSLVMLNRFPYSNGHLMVAPRQHTSRLDELTTECKLDLVDSLALCQKCLETAFSPQGFNIGVNLGKAAGAGIDDHLHIHIVPRWEGDTNYMSVISDIRVMPEYLKITYDKLLPHFKGKDQ